MTHTKEGELEGIKTKIVPTLTQYGRRIESELPIWHERASAFDWLVAELLLRRTTRTVAEETFRKVVATYESWRELANAELDEIYDLVSRAGLGNQRSKQLKGLATEIMERHGGEAPRSHESLQDLPGVGRYTADAVSLYSYGKRHFPLDGGVQRVFRRVVDRPIPTRTAHTDVYRDPFLTEVADHLSRFLHTDSLTSAHRGVLEIAWSTCKKKSPNCQECPLWSECKYADRRPESGQTPNLN